MPFTKKTKKEVTVSGYLGISEAKEIEIREFIKSRIDSPEPLNKGKFLLELNEKYDDKELLYASFAFGAIGYAMSHRDPFSELLSSLIK